ncbi:hypothetical protein ACLOJK_027924 [Asimina triloba]
MVGGHPDGQIPTTNGTDLGESEEEEGAVLGGAGGRRTSRSGTCWRGHRPRYPTCSPSSGDGMCLTNASGQSNPPAKPSPQSHFLYFRFLNEAYMSEQLR